MTIEDRMEQGHDEMEARLLTEAETIQYSALYSWADLYDRGLVTLDEVAEASMTRSRRDVKGF